MTKPRYCLYCGKIIEPNDISTFLGNDDTLGPQYAHEDCYQDMLSIAHDREEYQSRMEPHASQSGGSHHQGQVLSGK